jgi:RND family efflux transporter MFP subunit
MVGRPFQAALDQAKAAVVQADANLAFAVSDLERGHSLVTGTSITQQTLDQRVQAKRVAEANVTAQQAATRQAELDLQFTELAAPVAGRIGDRRVSIGNLVTGGTTGTTTLLATIASVDPIRFEFTMDESSYLRYLRAATDAQSNSVDRGIRLPAKLKLIDEKDFVHEGRIDFVDNAIDRSSGTIRGRAEFANPDGKLTPGMFGRIRIAASAPAEALLVPDTAIGAEQATYDQAVVYSDGNVAWGKVRYDIYSPRNSGKFDVKSDLNNRTYYRNATELPLSDRGSLIAASHRRRRAADSRIRPTPAG